MTHMNQAMVNFERRGNSSAEVLDPQVLFANRDPPQDSEFFYNEPVPVYGSVSDSLDSGFDPNRIYFTNDTTFYNVTAAIPVDYAVVMFGYIMPFLLVLTIMSNTFIVIVLSRKHMITPTNIVLLAMACVDMLTLLFPGPWYFYMYTMGRHVKILFPVAACYAFNFMTEAVPSLFHTTSIWLTLVLAIQRYIYVCHPTLARTWCTGWFILLFHHSVNIDIIHLSCGCYFMLGRL